MKLNSMTQLSAGIVGAALLMATVFVASRASAVEVAPIEASPSAESPMLGPEATLSPADTAPLEILLDATDCEAGVFDAEQAVAAGASSSAVADFAATYRASGEVATNLTPNLLSSTSATGERIAAAASSCTSARGTTGFFGWGWQWALNSCDTDLLIAALAGGGGAATAGGGIVSAAGVTAPAGGNHSSGRGLVAAGAGVVGIGKAAS